jgi:predicted NACHT family NTPase
MTLPTLVAAETGKWLWKEYGQELTDGFLDVAEEIWAAFNWEAAATKYRRKIIDVYGTTRIFGQPRPVSLENIFTEVYVLEKPTAFRRFDIDELERDPEVLQDEKRIHGRTLLRQQAAQRLLILGKPGAGKTTFLKHLALEAAKGRIDKVPIFVTLKDWADSEKGLLEFIAGEFVVCDFPDADRFIKHILENTDDALVLFDGLDEVNETGGQRARVIRMLRDFGRQYRRAQCLITCRVAATDYAFEQFTYVEVADFTSEQIKAFVKKWFSTMPTKGKAFLQEIGKEEHRGLREMAQVPLLLAMLCLAFNDDLRFPMRRVELYRDALEALLRKWDSSRNIKRDEIYRELATGRKHQLFAQIAARAFDEGRYFLAQEELEAQIVAYLSRLPPADAGASVATDGEVVLKAIEAQHGILVERAHRIHAFAHLTFQEYFTAKYKVENARKGMIPELLARCTDARWREVILLSASLLADADDFFVEFQRAVDRLIERDNRLMAFVMWAARKVDSYKVDYKTAAVRGYCCYRALFHDLARTCASDAARNWGNDLDLACEGALALARDLDPVLANDLDSAGALSPDLDLDHACDRALTLALGRAEGREPARAHVLALARDLARDCDRGLCQVLDNLRTPTTDDSTEEWQGFADELKEMLVKYRDIGHDWDFSAQQGQCLAEYFQANRLLVECLKVAYVSDRGAIEDSLLLPPGEWEAWV